MNTPLIIAGLLLALKHFIADGPAQTTYQYLNKGNVRHPGGYLHAGLHGLMTAMVLGFWAGLIDAMIHFWIDWAKVNTTDKHGWAYRSAEVRKDGVLYAASELRITSNWYFYALMADQCLHFTTYIILLAVFL